MGTATFRFCTLVFLLGLFSSPYSALSLPLDAKLPSLLSQDDPSYQDDSLGSLDRHFNQYFQMMHSSGISAEEYHHHMIDDYEEIRSRSNSMTFLERHRTRIAMNRAVLHEEGIRTQSFSDSDDETVAQMGPNGYEPDSDSDITVMGPDDFDGAETELELGSDDDHEFIFPIPDQ